MDIKLKFGIASLTVVIFQTILKLIGTLLTNSLSLLSETVDTITDIGFVSLTIYSLYHSQRPPDYEHMYGHRKIESVGALIQAIILLNLYGILIIYAIQVILEANFFTSNPDIGIYILFISIGINLGFSRILIWQGRKKKSLVLEMQGLNLFQDSMRGFVVVINFVLALFGVLFIDPIFSIGLSIYIIITALILSRSSIQELLDTNPIDFKIIEGIRQEIFNLDHVIGVEDLRIRTSGSDLFLEVHLNIEDHISIVHANEITSAIRLLTKQSFPNYEIMCTIEMHPMKGEESLSEELINLVTSMIPEFPGIIDVKDFNIVKLENENFLSIIIIVDENLSLSNAHKLCSDFEGALKDRVPLIFNIITHIEPQARQSKACFVIRGETEQDLRIIAETKQKVEEVLRKEPYILGFHDFKLISAGEVCILELHVFFDGALNISKVHDYLTRIEQILKSEIEIVELQDIILHSEPLQEREDSLIF